MYYDLYAKLELNFGKFGVDSEGNLSIQKL